MSATKSIASSTGTIHLGPRLNFEGSRKGNAMATISVIAIGQRFSPWTGDSDVSTRSSLPPQVTLSG